MMNATLKSMLRIGRFEQVGLGILTDQTVASGTYQRDNAPGSYGRGCYAHHSTYALDFRTEGSYGRGSYAGHSTADLDFSAQGSYGRGSYANHSSTSGDFGPQGSFAS